MTTSRTASREFLALASPVLVTVNGTPHTRNLAVEHAEPLAAALRGTYRLAIVKVELESEWRLWEA